ncbi:MAG: VOC family protein, partial [Anaerolineales bacterium]
MPTDAHLGRIHLKISDLDRSLEFYSDLLGFQVLERDAQQAALTPPGGTVPLINLLAIRNARPKPPRTTGLYHFAIRLPERPALGTLLKRLLEQRYPLQGAADHLVSEAVYLADPDGNGIELYIDRPREDWPRIDDQIGMATDPLDAEGLLKEANSQWDGIHPGTDIGHVHLHVADLSQAEDFYCGLLGFEVTQRSYPGALFVGHSGRPGGSHA